jgi:5-methylthioadenosine/S-adenosylhomocysteine deaminase
MPQTEEFRLSRRAVMGGIGLSFSALAFPALAQTAASPRNETLLSGASILSLDPERPLATGDIHVRDGEIVSIGESLDVPGADRLDMRGRIVLPGLVDTHWHMWNSLARGFSMSKYGPFAKTMAPLSAAWTPEASALAVRLATAEAINAGITTVNNWAHNTKGVEFAEAELAAMRESGIRGRFSYGYPQALKPDEKMDFAALEGFLGKHAGGRTGLVDLGICTRGPDRSAAAIWREEWAFAREKGLPVTTHIASDRKSGAMGNIATMAKEGLLGPDIQLVHATHATEEDFRLIREAGSPVSISPWTELQVGYGVPPIAAMAEAGIVMGLSVDNMVLSGNADMFSVMKVTADIAAGQAETQGKVPDATVLDWAVRGGAKSLGLDQRIGRLAPGMRADIIAVRTGDLNTVGAFSPEFLLTHSAQPDDVDFVMIDGTVHKRDGRLTSIDVAALSEEAETMMARLRSEAGL